MGKLNQVSGKEALKALGKLGFRQVNQTGSHVKMRKTTPDGSRNCEVPKNDLVPIGTLMNIIRQAGITKEEFLKNL